jgi:LacI family transcriptional regulator
MSALFSWIDIPFSRHASHTLHWSGKRRFLRPRHAFRPEICWTRLQHSDDTTLIVQSIACQGSLPHCVSISLRFNAASMLPSRITLYDVAKAAGVHASTASRALNAETRHLITSDVVDRVQKTADKLGYQHNAIASSLRTRRSNAVGIVIPDLLNSVFPPIIVGIEEMLGEAGYVLTIASLGNDAGRHSAVLDAMLARQVDGLILATATLDDVSVERLVRRGIPLVMVNRRDRTSRAPSVVTDDESGIALAVEHLVALGHRRIGHIAGPQTLSTGVARLRGFVAAMQSRNLVADNSCVEIAKSYSRVAGKEAVAALLGKRSKITAIVAANDLLALGGYDAFREAKLRCPEDISITGYNDMPLVDLVSPPLTTVRIQHRQMGIEAARLLIRKLEDPKSASVGVILNPDLVVRASTASPKTIHRR